MSKHGWYQGGRRLLIVGLFLAGCGGTATFFNPSFINAFQGGYYPITPGPEAAFVLVRVVNETTDPADFIVTIERMVIVEDADGNPQYDDDGNLLTTKELETVRLRTFPVALANDIGVLFPCEESPVIRIGLGENLLAGEPAAFIYEDYNVQSGVVGGGYGVAAEGLNTLSYFAANGPNFVCGDTVVFRMFTSTSGGSAGNVKFQAFLQPGSEQPSVFAGPNTFVNYSQFLQSQVREDNP